MRMMVTLMAVAALAAAASAWAGLKQTPAELQAQSAKIFQALKGVNAKGIACRWEQDKKATVILKSGWNEEDRSGMLVEGTIAYGTNEIHQISAGREILVRYGEEGNYLLAVQDTDDLLKQRTGSALLLNEDNQVLELECVLF
jgi:hypothetical protein